MPTITPLDQISSEKAKATDSEPNRWYLAYGSNLSSKTFQGRRGVHPLARCNVTVPSLELTFDLPGIPYWEPCFANVRRRDLRDLASNANASNNMSMSSKNTTPVVLTGVAYLITPEDYRKVIASEGGGVAYDETAVECWRIPATASAPAPTQTQTQTHPAQTSRAPAPDAAPRVATHAAAAAAADTQGDMGDRLIAYTLLAKDSKRRSAPMAPSKRYINIIQSGARDRIRYYQKTGIRQKVGASLFLAMWFPVLCVVILSQTTFADKKTGRTPGWLGTFSDAVSSAMWRNYERVWKRMIGSGEITEGHGASSSSSSITTDDTGEEASTETSMWDTPTDAVTRSIPLLYRRGTGA